MDKNKSGLFGYLLLLTGIFVLLEISFFLQRSGFYLEDFRLVASHLAIPPVVLPGILFYFFAQFILHISFTAIVWATARLCGIALDCTFQKVQTLGFSLWFLALLTILFANEYYFPNSRYSDLLYTVFNYKLAFILLMISAGMCGIALLVAGAGLVRLLMRTLPVISRMIFGVIFLTSTAGFMIHHQSAGVVDAASKDKPNIIIIGIDSLRPDYLGFLGGHKNTPQLDEFINHAIVFAQAVTPQARTFPAWVSILSGMYPKKIGARYDLISKSEINLDNTMLPQILQKNGYETLYATDETRFSNIDEAYGFDNTVTPPMGFNDFLLGTLNDFPFSNLVINTVVGKWLFPASYANRAAYMTYDPDSFLKMLQPALAKSRDKPLFLAVHFCLPHFPYFWRDLSFRETTHAEAHYTAALGRIDQQFGDFMAMLDQNGLLKHSIVVILSDHGEAMELHGDRITDRDKFIAGKDNKKKIIPQFYPKAFKFESVNQSAGHGTDVLSITQYHTVLAFRLYGEPLAAPPTVVAQLVTLMDINPTLQNLLGLQPGDVDGVSLTPYLLTNQKNTVTEAKNIFLESDFSPQSVRAVHPEVKSVLFEGIDFFSIDPVTTRITTKKSAGDLILSSRQYADISGAWILALYPQAKGTMLPILVNLQNGQWTNDLTTAFAKSSPADQMLLSLQKFYGRELTSVRNTFKSVS